MNEPDLMTAIDAMTPEQLTGATIALDHVTRPLTVREIEHALRRHGVVKSRATLFAASLRKLSIIAVVGPEQAA